MSEPPVFTSKEETPTLRVRRYLPYLGIYASDVRSVVERVEALEIELARAVEHNGALVELAKTATRDAVEEVRRLLDEEIETERSLSSSVLRERDALQLRLDSLSGDSSAPETSVRPRSEWHEDYGDVLWWRFPVVEAPYVGSPLCETWAEHELEGFYTHWSPIPIPAKPWPLSEETADNEATAYTEEAQEIREGRERAQNGKGNERHE